MRKALIIGIDHYPNSPLKNAVNDAQNITKLLSHHDDGTKNFHCKTLLSDSTKITERLLRASIRQHYRNDADIALLYFAGHGLGNEYGGYLVAPDAQQNDEGIAFSEILTLANNSPIKEIIIILDCCHSGHLGNLPIVGDDKAILRKGISILTSSASNQSSVETFGEGVFTNLVCSALRGEAANILGEVTVAGLYNHAEKLLSPWEQRPIFKAYLSNMITVRKCKPVVHIQELRKIADYFKHENYKYPLSPAYEPDTTPHDTEKEAIFATLQKFRAANLVEPVGEVHMYYAALNSKSCRLTKLGQFYWTMVIKDKI